ncbi:ankyrin [Penicillium atrosanguineum]|nr:ankyrin [Penicillium atrosanguineum]
MELSLPSTTTISERRRAQNRSAQRRFRQRREQQQQQQYNSLVSMLGISPIEQYPTMQGATAPSIRPEPSSYPSELSSPQSYFTAPEFQDPNVCDLEQVDRYLSHWTTAVAEGTGLFAEDYNTLAISDMASSASSSASSLYRFPSSSFPSTTNTTPDCPTPPPAYLTSQAHNGESFLSPDQKYIGVLHIAAQKGHDRIVRILLRHNQPRLDCNAPDSEGRTPLMHAVVAGHEAVVRALLAAGARCDPVDHLQRSVLHLAVLYRREPVLRMLLWEVCGEIELVVEDKEGDGRRVGTRGMELLGAYDVEGNTPLHLAVVEGFEAGVVMLLRSGSDLEAQARR